MRGSIFHYCHYFSKGIMKLMLFLVFFFLTTNHAPPMSKIYSDVFFWGFFFNMLVWEG